MADAFQMGEHRNAGFALNQADQALAATGDDDVDVVDRLQHGRHHLAVAGRDELDRGFRKTRGAQPLDHAGVNGFRGFKAFTPTAQDDGIAGFQAKRPGIGGHVGPGFVDHADHAKGRCDPLDMQPVRAVPFGQHPTDRVFLFGNLAQRIDNAPQASVIQSQPVQHRGRQALLHARIQIQRVGVQNGIPPPPDRIGRRDQRRRLPL